MPNYNLDEAQNLAGNEIHDPFSKATTLAELELVVQKSVNSTWVNKLDDYQRSWLGQPGVRVVNNILRHIRRFQYGLPCSRAL